MTRTLIVEGEVFELVPGATADKWMVLHDATLLGVVQRVAGRYEAVALAVPNRLGTQSRNLLGLVRDTVERQTVAPAGAEPLSDSPRAPLDTLPLLGTPGIDMPAGRS